MEGFFNALSAVALLLALMSVGYGMGRAGWMAAGEKRFLSKYIINIAVPCNCLTGVLNNLDRSMLKSAGLMLLAAFLAVAATLLLSIGAARLLRLPQNQRGVFIAMGAFSNTLFVGLPVTTQLFGDACIPYVMLYYLANTVLVQTVGVLLVSRSGSAEAKVSLSAVLADMVKKPPVLGVLCSVTLLAAGLRPPELAMTFVQYISGTVSPLALIYCGFILYEVGLRNLRFQRGLPTMLALRLGIAPLMCFVLCRLFGMQGLALSVFVVESALPVVTQVTVMAGAFGADEQYAASGACLSTLGCCLTIPAVMLMLG